MNEPLNNPVTSVVMQWIAGQPFIVSLLALQLLDIASGIAVAVGAQTVSSTISWRGAMKKVMVWMIIGVSAVLEPWAQGIPLTKLAALFFIVAEGMSILEHAAMLGVPLPPELIATLSKLKQRDANVDRR